MDVLTVRNAIRYSRTINTITVAFFFKRAIIDKLVPIYPSTPLHSCDGDILKGGNVAFSVLHEGLLPHVVLDKMVEQRHLDEQLRQTEEAEAKSAAVAQQEQQQSAVCLSGTWSKVRFSCIPGTIFI